MTHRTEARHFVECNHCGQVVEIGREKFKSLMPPEGWYRLDGSISITKPPMTEVTTIGHNNEYLHACCLNCLQMLLSVTEES